MNNTEIKNLEKIIDSDTAPRIEKKKDFIIELFKIKFRFFFFLKIKKKIQKKKKKKLNGRKKKYEFKPRGVNKSNCISFFKDKDF